MVQGNSWGWSQAAAPDRANSCGTFFEFRYGWIAAFVLVPTVAMVKRTWSSSTSLRVASMTLVGS